MSISPRLILYRRVNLVIVLLDSKVFHPKSWIMAVTLVVKKHHISRFCCFCSHHFNFFSNSSSKSQVYTLKFGSQKVPVYCHMGDFGCGDGGWTLAMKIDGSKVRTAVLLLNSCEPNDIAKLQRSGRFLQYWKYVCFIVNGLNPGGSVVCQCDRSG